MNSWDAHFLRIAREASTRSKDPSTKVGAVLVHGRRILETGYNGFPAAIADNQRLHIREQKYRLVIHAEMNAILRAGKEACGATLYMYGFDGAPCTNCTKHLIAVEVERIVVCGPPIPDRWKRELYESELMLGEAKVAFDRYPLASL